MTMYRITKTIFLCRNGEKVFSNEPVEVEDIEAYRKSIKKSKHVKVNFIYQIIDSDGNGGKN